MKRYGCYFTLPGRVVPSPVTPCHEKDAGIRVNGFHRINAPNQQQLTELVPTLSHRVAGFLEREGILERDEENSYLNLEDQDEDPMQQVSGSSVSYRIAIGPQQGHVVFTLQTIPAWEEDDCFTQVAKVVVLACGD